MIQKPESFEAYKNTFSVCLSIPTFHIFCLCLPSRKKRGKRGSGEHYVGDGGGGGREERRGTCLPSQTQPHFPTLTRRKRQHFSLGNHGMAVCTYLYKDRGGERTRTQKGPPPGIEGRRKLISQKSSRKSCQPDATGNTGGLFVFCLVGGKMVQAGGCFLYEPPCNVALYVVQGLLCISLPLWLWVSDPFRLCPD